MLQHRCKTSKAGAATLLCCMLLSSCSSIDREYRLRFWEKCRTTSEQALKKNRVRQARSMAEEAVYQAQGFGDSDFRLGVSLCDLADALKADGKYKEAEDYYKRAESVLKAAESKEIAAKDASQRAGKKDETATNELLRELAREDLANTLSHRADLYAMQEKNKDAAACFLEAADIYQSMLGGNQWNVDDSAMGQELVQCLVGLAQVSIALKDNGTADRAYARALDVAVASNCPEFTLRDIRDSYLKLLQEMGHTKEARQLVADALFTKFTSEGMHNVNQNNLPEAEADFRQAYKAAQESIFSQRRLMRALFNLQYIFIKENKIAEMDPVFNQATKLMITRGLRFDNDFDLMLAAQAKFYLQTNRPRMAAVALGKQLEYRYNHYGPNSIQVCETLALKGMTEVKSFNIPAAEQSAEASYKIITARHMSNRRAGNAMMDTATLMVSLHHFKEAETLEKQFADIEFRNLDPKDPRVVGIDASLFVLYHNAHKHDEAMQIVHDIEKRLKLANDQNARIQAMPYIVLIQAYSCVLGWWDAAEAMTTLGQQIIKNDMNGAQMDPMNQNNWIKYTAQVEAHFGRKF